MKKNPSYYRWLIAINLALSGTSLSAAPLTWLPGPSLDVPLSAAATTATTRYGNVLLGGDAGYYVQSILATNNYSSDLQPLQNVLLGPGAFANNDMMVVYGGDDGTGPTSGVTGYGFTDAAPALASMQTARAYLGYAPDASGRAYAIGGLDVNGQPLASAERFTPNFDNPGPWSYLASLPAARYDFPAVLDRTNNVIYIFGGYTNADMATEIDSVLRYLVSKNTWTNMAAMPVATAGSAATFGADGKIYVVGGISDGVATDVVQVYNPVNNSWTLGTPLPEALSSASLGTDSLGRLVLMGGRDINGDDLSDVWRSQQLNVRDSSPSLTIFPGTNATYLNVYTSSINATGNPSPTYSLLSGPIGMLVDYYTGAITWTPQGINQIGPNLVIIQAVNFAGSTNWSFTINVPNPPPTVLTNLQVVSVTESSVTLSWSPEDPTVGPVTYSLWLRHVIHDARGSGATIWYTSLGTTTNTTFTVSGLAAGLAQAYYITATGVSGTSDYASIGAATLSAPPPTNLQLTGLTSKTISLAWEAPTNSLPIVSYNILGVYNGVFVQYPLSFSNITNTNFTIVGLAPGTALQLGVAAKDNLGNISDYIYLPNLIINPSPVPPVLNIVWGAAPTPSTTGSGLQIIVSAGNSDLQTFLLQATTNPADSSSWEQIDSALPTSNTFTFTDTNATQYPARFYRIVAP